MFKRRSTTKGLAFTLVLAMLLTMVPMLPFSGQVDEVYAAAPPGVTSDPYSSIYANGHAIILTQGAYTTSTCIYLDENNNGMVDAEDILVELTDSAPTGTSSGGYDLKGFSIYGGAENVAVTSTSITMLGGTVNNVYGGGKEADAAVSGDTRVTIDGGEVKQNVYGGGYQGSVSGRAILNIRSGTVSNVYGGGKEADAAVSGFGGTTVTISGDTVVSGNVYGGGYQGSVSDDTCVTISISGGRIGNPPNTNTGMVYGGGWNGSVSGSATVNLFGGEVYSVYGGGYLGSVSGSAKVNMRNGTTAAIYGGGWRGSVFGDTSVNISGGAVTYCVYGGGQVSGTAVSGDTSVNISGGKVEGNVYGGGDGGSVSGDTSVNISGGTVDSDIYGGGATGSVSGSAIVNIGGGAVSTVYGGGYKGSVSGSAIVNISGGTIGSGAPDSGNVYGGGMNAQATVSGGTSVTISDGEVKSYVYGGGDGGSVSGGAIVDISGGEVNLGVYGGGKSGSVSGGAIVDISGGKVSDNVYGGGQSGSVSGNTSVTISGGEVSTIYGGGNEGSVSGSAIVNISGEVVAWNVYGGGMNGKVSGSSIVNISGGHVTYNVYGGGQFGAATVSGSAIVNISGGVVDNDVYGGGKSGSVSGTTAVAIAGGSIGGSVTPQPKKGDTQVYKATLTLKDAEGNAVTNITIGGITGVTYDCTDMKTDNSGKIIIYLPTGTSISKVTANSKTYNISGPALTVTDDGNATGDFYEIPAPLQDSPSRGGSSSAGKNSITKTDDTKDAEKANEGSVSFSSERAPKGATVTITVEENVSYEAGLPVVTDAEGNNVPVTDNGDGTYSFVMPATQISVNTPFEPIFEQAMNTPPFRHSERSQQSVTINNKNVNIGAYNIDGNNYVKLRDLASVLTGTGSKFAVATGEDMNIILTPGQSYEAIGGELEPGVDRSGTCVVSQWTVTINGVVRYMHVYNIGGNNYFKLRDLGKLLGFDVDYDRATNTALVTTK